VTATTIGGALAGSAAHFCRFTIQAVGTRLVQRAGLDGVALVVCAAGSLALSVRRVAVWWGGRTRPALQAAGVTGAYHLFNAAPYVLTLVLMAFASQRTDAPANCG